MSYFKSRRPAFAALAVVHATGAVFSAYFNFLPSRSAIVLAAGYASIASMVILLHVLQGFREAVRDPVLSAEFKAAGASRYFIAPILIAFYGITGFFFVST